MKHIFKDDHFFGSQYYGPKQVMTPLIKAIFNLGMYDLAKEAIHKRRILPRFNSNNPFDLDRFWL